MPDEGPAPVSLYAAMRRTPAVRAYTAETVGLDTIHRVLDNARFAASGGNRQPWRVVCVFDEELRRRVGEQHLLAYRETEVYATKGLDWLAEHLAEVPLLLVVCVELSALSITDRQLPRQSIVGGASIYPFVQNLLLALRHEGCGSVLTTLLCSREAELREILAIPDGFAIACVLPVGRPLEAIPRPVRRPVGEFAWLDRFGGTPVSEAGG
jgi:nitroreductase